LYRRPKILFLDEATSHLDSEREREISQVLQHLKITRINIAHRSELAAAADVMLRFKGLEWATSIPARSRAIAQSPGRSVLAGMRHNVAAPPAE
jgi:ATP-binding cassette subfamily B protein RaxB